MYRYSTRSALRLSSCRKELQEIFNEVIKVYDNSIICGFRNEAEQNMAFNSKNSKVQWPNGKHNTEPSNAVDAIPYPTQWDDIKAFYVMHGVVMACANKLGYVKNIRWGGDWDRDNDLNDQTFMDLGHWEWVD